MTALVVPAPAKVNLFLHVTGRRADGYHTLESLFALIDLADTVTLERRDDGAIVRPGAVAGVPADADLAVRAARALQHGDVHALRRDDRTRQADSAGGGPGRRQLRCRFGAARIESPVGARTCRARSSRRSR